VICEATSAEVPRKQKKKGGGRSTDFQASTTAIWNNAVFINRGLYAWRFGQGPESVRGGLKKRENNTRGSPEARNDGQCEVG